jgi:Bardet-Biedl syndrome 1 protein
LRFNTAKTYLGLLGDGVAPMAYAQGAQLRLTASYEGIGPVFKIKLQLQNLNKKPFHNLQVTLALNQSIYKLRDRNPTLPLMLPNVVYKVDLEVECLDQTGANDTIKVFVMDRVSTVPLITANIQMPVSEVNLE